MLFPQKVREESAGETSGLVVCYSGQVCTSLEFCYSLGLQQIRKATNGKSDVTTDHETSWFNIKHSISAPLSQLVLAKAAPGANLGGSRSLDFIELTDQSSADTR
jgi:hypothetical protein